MNKVVSMNLNGNAYQLDEPGYAALSAYLSEAKAHLADNPDQAEILADLEQAIADKLRRFLSAIKSVVTEEEVRSVITEMGPVDGGTGAGRGEEPAAGPKRLYRIREGSYVGGVAAGVAAYFNVDDTLVRIVFVALTVMTSGGFIFAYVLGLIFIPLARTKEEEAAASGAPFNAEEFIARAKANIALGRAEGMRQWKAWKQDRRAERKAYREAYAWQRYGGYRGSALGELAGILVFTFFVWLGYHHVPAIREFLNAGWSLWHRAADQIAQFIAAHDKS